MKKYCIVAMAAFLACVGKASAAAPVLSTFSSVIINEDTSTNVAFTVTDADSADTNVIVSASIANSSLASVSVSGSSTNRTLNVVSVPNANGSTAITVLATDGTTAVSNTFALVISPVNDAPSFTLSTNRVTTGEDSSTQTNLNFATNISAGPTNESGQGLTFYLTTTNTAFFLIQPTISAAGTLSYKPAANAFGTNTVSVRLQDTGGTTSGTNSSPTQTFTVVVTPTNDAPVISVLSARSINEDAGTTNIAFTVTDVDTDSTNVSVTATSSNTNIVGANVTGSTTNRVLALTTVADMNGTSSISVVAFDGALRTTNTFVLTVNAVNDAPSFTLSTNAIYTQEDGPAYTNVNFVTGISRGPTNESSQTLAFALTTANTAFFATQPTLSTNGTLIFKAAANASGTNTVTVRLTDNGGTSFGGTNGSIAQSFNVIVVASNDAPVMSAIAPQTIVEDSGTNTIVFTVSDSDTALSNVFVTATCTNASLVDLSVTGSSSSRTLNIVTLTNQNGSAYVKVVATDGLSFTTNTFLLAVSAVNDAPSFTMATNVLTSDEDAGLINVTNFATSISRGADNESSDILSFIVSTTNTTFYAVQPSIGTNGVLTYKTATNVFGTNILTVHLQDSGGTGNGGTNTSVYQTVTVVVNGVNDAPILSAMGARAIGEDSGTNVIAFTVTDTDSAMSNVIVTATSTNLVAADVTGSGTSRSLLLITSNNITGTTTIKVVATDGIDSRTNTFTLTVNAVNDAPTFTLSTNQVSSDEDQLNIITNFVTNISAGPTNESSQTVAFIVTTGNTAFYSTQPSINTSGTLTYRPATNVFGTNFITIRAQDNGSISSGGTNGSVAQIVKIVVAQVNDAPTIAPFSSLNPINEDKGTTNITITVRDIDTAISNVVVTATSLNPALITAGAVTNTTAIRTVPLTTVSNAYGIATIRLVAFDGTARSTNTFTITINPVNDAPSFELSTDTVLLQQFGTLQTVSNFVINISKGPTNESGQGISFVVTTNDGSFFTTKPTISAGGTLTYACSTRQAGTNVVTVRAVDSGGLTFGGTNSTDTKAFSIIVASNPYALLAGAYNGLFYESGNIANNSSGSFLFNLTTNGAFSGQLKLGNTYPFSGQLNASGTATVTVVRSGLSSLSLTLVLDITGGLSQEVSGNVTDGIWRASLLGDRSVYNAVSNPCLKAGKYTMVIPGIDGSTTRPAGDGYGTITVAADGTVTLVGTLADGTSVSQSTKISRNNEWPLYIPLYTTTKGSLLGWLTFASTATNSIAGNVSWIKTGAAGGTNFTAGFTNVVAVRGSTYAPPTPGTRLLSLTSGSVVAADGGLTSSFTNRFNLTTNNVFSMIAPITNSMSLSVATNTGYFAGSFIHPVTGSSTTFRGVVLQQTTNGAGYFLSTDKGGSILLK